MEQLARGHDRVSTALNRYAAAARRSGPRGFPWWTAPALLATAFLGWTSADALQTITDGGIPFPVAALPGLALATALAGMTVVTAAALRDSGQPRAALWPSVLSGFCAISAAVWVALWLESTVQAARMMAFTAGVLFVLVVAAATFGAVLYGGPRRSPDAHARRPPRTRLRRRLAEKAIRSHEQAWTLVAHQTGVLLTDAPEARAVLLRLIDGRYPPTVPDDLDPVHALILTGLRDHHPRDLLADLARIDHSVRGSRGGLDAPGTPSLVRIDHE
jgi:hypothetical protein